MKLGLSVLAWLLLGAVVALGPLGYATPPDPTWIAGFWDDGDYDDVITLITSCVGAIEPHLIRAGDLIHVVGITPPQIAERAARSLARSSPPARAPPV
jgi:hypothetical protein